MKEALFKSLFIAAFVVIGVSLISLTLEQSLIPHPGPTFLGFFTGNLLYEVYKIRRKAKKEDA